MRIALLEARQADLNLQVRKFEQQKKNLEAHIKMYEDSITDTENELQKLYG